MTSDDRRFIAEGKFYEKIEQLMHTFNKERKEQAKDISAIQIDVAELKRDVAYIKEQVGKNLYERSQMEQDMKDHRDRLQDNALGIENLRGKVAYILFMLGLILTWFKDSVIRFLNGGS